MRFLNCVPGVRVTPGAPILRPATDVAGKWLTYQPHRPGLEVELREGPYARQGEPSSFRRRDCDRLGKQTTQFLRQITRCSFCQGASGLATQSAPTMVTR